MRTATILLCAVACAAGVRVGFAPPASSYVYRSDNGGPPSLLQLGPAFAAPPVPLPYVNAQPIAIEDAEEDAEHGFDADDDDDGDDDDEAGVEHAHEAGGGARYGEEHRAAHGEKGHKGYASRAHHAKGSAGEHADQHHEGYYHENKGEKGAHHDEADAHGAHHQAGKSYKGGDHGHKQHFSKGEDVTGYHKVFSKDEFKKDHDFYDEAAKDGHFQKHGYHKAHHGAEKGAHTKGGHSGAGFARGAHGDAGFRTAGRVDEADEDHSAEEGADAHYRRHEDYGEKGARDHAREYAFAEGDDGDDEE
ncbi:histidine-rich glycoprotein-like [Pararge aegeria]|uniref:histidine-rich glycoprotein-like n=1 Tax=Pararge aegeria TaxID=116150 RepID=UPI0019CF89F2|nr:histidine-rich glycoprotein-like [Pararge aegeria]